MFHGAEPCTMEIDVFHILHNYSNIVSFRCNFQTKRGIYIWCKWKPNSYSWRAHTSSYSACAFMNENQRIHETISWYWKQIVLHALLFKCNDSHIHGMFIQTRFNKKKSHIYIMFQRYIYNYVHFRLRCLDSVFHSEQQRRRFFGVFFQNKVRLQGIPFDINWHSTLLRWCFNKSAIIACKGTLVLIQK